MTEKESTCNTWLESIGDTLVAIGTALTWQGVKDNNKQNYLND